MDRKSYNEVSFGAIALTLSDLERSIQVTEVFSALYVQIYTR